MVDGSFSNKRIAKNTIFLYMRMVFVLLVSLYTVRVVLSALGEVDYGVYNVVCGFVALFGVLNTTLSSGTSRFYNYEIGEKGEEGAKLVYNTSFVIMSSAAIIVFILIEIVGSWYLNHKMVIPVERMSTARLIFQFSTVSLIFVMIQTPYSAAVISYEKMDYYAIVGITDAVLKLSIALLIKNSQYDKLLIYGILMFLISLVNFLMYFFFCKIKLKELKLHKGFSKRLFKPMLSFSGWLILDPIAYTLKGQGTNVALNYFHGPIMNTAFGISNQVSVALDSFSGNISTAFKPQMIQSYSSGNYKRTKGLFFSMSKILFVLKLLLCIPIVLEADTILHLWLGETFPSITVPFMKLLIIISVINSFCYPITIIISATGKIKRYMIITSTIVSAVLPISIVLLFCGINPICVFWTMMVSAILNLFVCIWILSVEFDAIRIKEYFKKVFLPCLSHTILSIIMPIAIYHFMCPSLIRFFFVCLVTLVSSGASIYLIVLDVREKTMLMDFVNKLFKRNSIMSEE